MTVNELRQMLDSGKFHHATYRNFRTLWEGLWIYERDETGFKGYRPAGSFGKDSPDLDEAQTLLMSRGIGSHLGAYGHG